MARILVWRDDKPVGVAKTTGPLVVENLDDLPTSIGRPRGPETPVCRNCGRDARLHAKLYRFNERRPGGVIASGWRCA